MVMLKSIIFLQALALLMAAPIAAATFKVPVLSEIRPLGAPAPARGPAIQPTQEILAPSAILGSPAPAPAAEELSPLQGLLENGPLAARLAGQESGDASRSDSTANFNRAGRLEREGHPQGSDAVDARAASERAPFSPLEAPLPVGRILTAAPQPESFGLTDKKRGRTGYFEYQLDDQGRIWTRYAPILAPKPFEIPVTEHPDAAQLKTRFEKLAGPYTYAYDETRRIILVTPKPDAAAKGFMLRGGRLAEVDRETAAQWRLHDGSGGPKLPKGVKIVGIQVSGEIIAARGSDDVIYLYKPTVPDAELPAKWSSDNGMPFGGELRLPKARDWAFGLSIGVKPSERPTLEFMNPYTDIDNYYAGADGGKAFYGFTATVGILAENGREIRYWDTGLPADFQRGFLTPYRGRVVGEKLAQAGSTWLLYGTDGGAPGLWVKGYDHEMLGSTPGLRFVFDSPDNDKSQIYDLAEAQRYVPLPPWRRIDLPALGGNAVLTDRISIHLTGQGNEAREITIEGQDAAGIPGYYRKLLSGKEWTFVTTGKTVEGSAMTPTNAPAPAKTVTHDYPLGHWRGFHGAPIAKVELNDFHPFAALDEASTLRITLESGKKVDALLRTTDGYSPLAHDARDDAAIDKGIGEEKVLIGTLELPAETENSPDPEIRAFAAKYLKPYHHIPNLFAVDADRDHVDIYTDGRYRKSDMGFDYGYAPELSISVKRDARGESEYELLAGDPRLKPSADLSATRLHEIIFDNEALIRTLHGDVKLRRLRHLGLLIRTFGIHVVTKAAFFFMNLFGITQKRHMGPISDIVPRFMQGHLRAHDLNTPAAYDRAVAILIENIRQAGAYK